MVISKVRMQGKDRKIIELPLKDRSDFNAGDYVIITKVSERAENDAEKD